MLQSLVIVMSPSYLSLRLQPLSSSVSLLCNATAPYEQSILIPVTQS